MENQENVKKPQPVSPRQSTGLTDFGSIKSSIVSVDEGDQTFSSTHYGMTSAELSLNLTALKQNYKIRRNKMQRQIDCLNFQVKTFFQSIQDGEDISELETSIS